MHTAGRSLLRMAALLLLLAGGSALAQVKHETFQATAMGEGSYFGKTFSVTIVLESYSTAADQQALAEAFEQAGNRGVVNALAKMGSRGNIAITGTLGYDISYARILPLGDGGRKIRLVTSRPITFGEAWADSPATGDNLSALELVLTADKSLSSGSLLPACQFSVSKEKELTLESYANPWKLVDVVVW